MPDQPEIDESAGLLNRGHEHVKRFWDGFLDFALQGNILEIAFGLILANAFTKLVNEFVYDILMPPVSLLLPHGSNMEEKFAVLRGGPRHDPAHGLDYNTLQQAKDDGAVVLAYGAFLVASVSFFGMGFALYCMARLYVLLTKDPTIIKHMVKCPYCRKKISDKALRCVNCTSWVDGREDRR